MLRHKLIGHYVSNELVGVESPKIKLQTIWGAKGGESDIAVLLQVSDTDIKMLEEDPRLEYVAVTRAMEKFYYVGFPRSVTESTVNIPEVEAVSMVPIASAPLVISTESRIELKRKFRRAPRP